MMTKKQTASILKLIKYFRKIEQKLNGDSPLCCYFYDKTGDTTFCDRAEELDVILHALESELGLWP